MKKKKELSDLALVICQILRRFRTIIVEMKFMDSQEILSRLSHRGLSEKLTSTDIRKAIAELRLSGEPIGSSNKKGNMGYCYCMNKQEYIEVNKHLLHRVKVQAQAYTAPISKFNEEQRKQLEMEL